MADLPVSDPLGRRAGQGDGHDWHLRAPRVDGRFGARVLCGLDATVRVRSCVPPFRRSLRLRPFDAAYAAGLDGCRARPPNIAAA